MGEFDEARRAKERVVKQLVDAGVPYEAARERAGASAVRVDRLIREGRVQRPKDRT